MQSTLKHWLNKLKLTVILAILSTVVLLVLSTCKLCLVLISGVLMYNPNYAPKLDLSINTLVSVMNNNYQELGTDIIQYACYPKTNEEIQAFLDGLHKHPALTCDIEAFSLNLFKAGIGSIAFAWNKNEGGAFAVDYLDIVSANLNQTIMG